MSSHELPHEEVQPQNAQEAFEQMYDAALDYLAAIKVRLIEYHDDGHPKSWANAGDMEHVLEELQQIAEFLGI